MTQASANGQNESHALTGIVGTDRAATEPQSTPAETVQKCDLYDSSAGHAHVRYARRHPRCGGTHRGIARVTPLVDVSAAAGRPFFLKCESLQPAGAFKIRGAYNMVAQLTDAQRRAGVITYSSGNHGQAMALAARTLGAPAVVVMPTTAPQIKIDGARAFGAEVIFAGTTSAERRARAESEAAARGLTMVPPFDHEWIIAGQATAGLEILEQMPDVAAVLVPIGGGGLAAGVAAADQAKPAARLT